MSSFGLVGDGVVGADVDADWGTDRGVGEEFSPDDFSVRASGFEERKKFVNSIAGELTGTMEGDSEVSAMGGTFDSEFIGRDAAFGGIVGEEAINCRESDVAGGT